MQFKSKFVVPLRLLGKRVFNIILKDLSLGIKNSLEILILQRITSYFSLRPCDSLNYDDKIQVLWRWNFDFY